MTFQCFPVIFPATFRVVIAIFPTTFNPSTAFFGTNPLICYIFIGDEKVAK